MSRPSCLQEMRAASLVKQLEITEIEKCLQDATRLIMASGHNHLRVVSAQDAAPEVDAY